MKSLGYVNAEQRVLIEKALRAYQPSPITSEPIVWVRQVPGRTDISFEPREGWTPLYATPPRPDREAWECMGRKQVLPEPGDCNWPDCGCDPYATKVIESLLEQGWNQPARGT